MFPAAVPSPRSCGTVVSRELRQRFVLMVAALFLCFPPRGDRRSSLRSFALRRPTSCYLDPRACHRSFCRANPPQLQASQDELLDATGDLVDDWLIGDGITANAMEDEARSPGLGEDIKTLWECIKQDDNETVGKLGASGFDVEAMIAETRAAQQQLALSQLKEELDRGEITEAVAQARRREIEEGRGLSEEFRTDVYVNDSMRFAFFVDPSAVTSKLRLLGSPSAEEGGLSDEEVLELAHNGDSITPAAVVMARYLAMQPPPVPIRNRTVLDLGAGCGCVGIVAAHLGAKAVLLQDRRQKNLQYALRNAVETGVASQISTLECSWSSLDEALRRPEGGAEQFAEADVLLAADVLYSQMAATSFAQTVIQLLRRPEQVLYIIDWYKRPHRPLFVEACQAEGLDVRAVEIVTWEAEADIEWDNDELFTNVLITVRRPAAV